MESSTRQSRYLRKNQTFVERRMRYALRSRRFLGLKFHRQYGIDRYIVDFYCDELGLIIEIDGDTHGYKSRMDKDKIKDEFFQSRNFQIIRFANDDIYNNLEGVVECLAKKCKEIKTKIEHS